MNEEATLAALCEEANDEAVPFGWRCANQECRAATASKRRGPNKEFCSKGPCRRLASLASAEVKDDANAKRIAALEQQVRDQATTIVLLRKDLAQAQAALERAQAATKAAAAFPVANKPPVAPQPTAKPTSVPPPARRTNDPALMALLQDARTAAPSSAAPSAAATSTAASTERTPLVAPQPSAKPASAAPSTATPSAATASAAAPSGAAPGARRPLAALSLNHEPRPVKKAKPSELTPVLPAEPVAQPAPQTLPWWKSGTLCPGWIARPSTTRPGEHTYTHKELGIHLRSPPAIQTEDGEGWHVQEELIKALIERFQLENDGSMPMEQLRTDFERAVRMKPGAVSCTKRLRKLVSSVAVQACEQLSAEWDDDREALCDWLEDADDARGRSLKEAVEAMRSASCHWDARRVRAVARMLEEEGSIYSTIDEDHFAITPPDSASAPAAPAV